MWSAGMAWAELSSSNTGNKGHRGVGWGWPPSLSALLQLPGGIRRVWSSQHRLQFRSGIFLPVPRDSYVCQNLLPYLPGLLSKEDLLFESIALPCFVMLHPSIEIVLASRCVRGVQWPGAISCRFCWSITHFLGWSLSGQLLIGPLFNTTPIYKIHNCKWTQELHQFNPEILPHICNSLCSNFLFKPCCPDSVL